MARINYPASSPYSATPQTSWYIGHYNYRKIPADASDTNFVVLTRHNERPDILSNDLYGTPEYWWVFTVRNRNLIKDPIFDLKAGMQIVVPSLDVIKKAIGS